MTKMVIEREKYSTYGFPNTPNEFIEWIKNVAKGKTNPRFSVGLENDYGDWSALLVVEYERPQTLEEKRREAEQKKNAEKWERQQYEALKKKFEKK